MKKIRKNFWGSLFVSALLVATSVPASAVNHGEGTTGTTEGQATTTQTVPPTTQTTQTAQQTQAAQQAPEAPTLPELTQKTFQPPVLPNSSKITQDGLTYEFSSDSIKNYTNITEKLKCGRRQNLSLSNSKLIITGDPQKHPKLQFNSLKALGSHCELYIKDVDLYGTIDFSVKAKLTLVNCTVNNNAPYRGDTSPYQIDMRKGASIQLQNVHFNFPDLSDKAQLHLSGSSTSIIDHCRFSSAPTKPVILITDKSSAVIQNSSFANVTKAPAVNVCGSCQINLKNCDFRNNSIDLLVSCNSTAVATDLNSTSSSKSVVIDKQSRAKLTNSQIRGCLHPAITAANNSEFNCLNLSFSDCHSNALRVDNSSGLMLDCEATSASSIPLIFVAGNHSDYVFARSRFKNDCGPVFAIRNFARPTVSKSSLESHSQICGANVSDFADPCLDDCEFNLDGPIKIEAGATPMVRDSRFSARENQAVFQFRNQGHLRTTPSSNTFPPALQVNLVDPRVIVAPNDFNFRLQEDHDHLDPICIGFTATKQTTIPTDRINATVLAQVPLKADQDGTIHTHNHNGEHFIIPCGHQITDEQATELEAKIAQKEEATCPQCQFKVTRIGTIFDYNPDSYDCSICLEKQQPKAFLVPCGHVICPECYLRNVEERGAKCPYSTSEVVNSCKVLGFDQTNDCDLIAQEKAPEKNPEQNQEAGQKPEQPVAEFPIDQQAPADQDQKADQTDQHEESTTAEKTPDQNQE